MRCIRCHSPRVVRFIDGFGERRIFCKSCMGSFLETKVIGFQPKLWEFSQDYYKKEILNPTLRSF